MLMVTSAWLAGCGGGTADPESQPSSPTISTLSPLPPPPSQPPSGRIVADLRQSSRDAAAGRMQVWIANDTAAPITPTKIIYRDPRLSAVVYGDRLRTNPAQSERGHSLQLPQPNCTAPVTAKPVLTVAHDGRSARVPVIDDIGIVERYVTARCLELAVAQVAQLSWSDEVARDGEVGTLELVIRPTGRPDGVLTIEEINGTPVLGAVGGASWQPKVTVNSDDPQSRLPLQVIPARCDPHAFAESGGATAFRIHLRLDGKPGQIVLRMTPAGARNAIDFALAACGLE